MGSSYPFAKEVLATMSPLLYSGSRYVIAGLFLFAVARRACASRSRLPRRDWLPMLLLSLVGVAVFQACWGLGMARTAPSVGSIVMTTTTAFSAILAWLQGRRLSALGWLGIAIAFAGVVMVVNNSLSRFTLALGNLTARCSGCSSAFAWALYVERCAPFNLRLGALRVMAWTTLIGSRAAGRARSPARFASASSAGSSDRQCGLLALHRHFPGGCGLPRPQLRLRAARGQPGDGLHVPDPGRRRWPWRRLFFGDPLTSARVLGGLIVLLGVILTRVALDRAARLR